MYYNGNFAHYYTFGIDFFYYIVKIKLRFQQNKLEFWR